MENRSSWAGGVILILIGTVFLLSNLGIFRVSGNWWAVFIILPSIWSWLNAWNQYQNNGHRVTRDVISGFTWGSMPMIIGLIFLFNLSWGIFWPLILIFAGLSALVHAQMGPKEEESLEESEDW